MELNNLLTLGAQAKIAVYFLLYTTYSGFIEYFNTTRALFNVKN